MDRTPRQIRKTILRLEPHFVLQQRGFGRRQEGHDSGQHPGPPFRSARIVHGGRVRFTGEVKARQHSADCSALCRRRRADVTAVKAGDQRGGFALECAEITAGAVGQRMRAGHAAFGEVRHQVQVERQFLRGQLFEQRQHVTAGAGGDELVGVFDARGNAVQFAQFADGVILQPVLQVFRAYRGENGHCLVVTGKW